MANHHNYFYSAEANTEGGINEEALKVIKDNGLPFVVEKVRYAKESEKESWITVIKASTEYRRDWVLEGAPFYQEQIDAIRPFFKDVKETFVYHWECNGSDVTTIYYKDGEEIFKHHVEMDIEMAQIHSEPAYEPRMLKTHLWSQDDFKTSWKPLLEGKTANWTGGVVFEDEDVNAIFVRGKHEEIHDVEGITEKDVNNYNEALKFVGATPIENEFTKELERKAEARWKEQQAAWETEGGLPF